MPARWIGVYGGAFDPPHIGHVVVACEAAWQLGLDEVRLVPVGQPVHRAAPIADASMRVRMLEAATRPHPLLSVSTVELDRQAPSYTVDTLTAIHAAEPDLAIALIIGADQLLAFQTWRDPGRILELARLAVVARGDTDVEAVAETLAALAPSRADIVSMPEIGVSATMIRERIAAGRPIAHLVPPDVAAIIAEAGLYGPPSTLT